MVNVVVLNHLDGFVGQWEWSMAMMMMMMMIGGAVHDHASHDSQLISCLVLLDNYLAITPFLSDNSIPTSKSQKG